MHERGDATLMLLAQLRVRRKEGAVVRDCSVSGEYRAGCGPLSRRRWMVDGVKDKPYAIFVGGRFSKTVVCYFLGKICRSSFNANLTSDVAEFDHSPIVAGIVLERSVFAVMYLHTKDDRREQCGWLWQKIDGSRLHAPLRNDEM